MEVQTLGVLRFDSRGALVAADPGLRQRLGYDSDEALARAGRASLFRDAELAERFQRILDGHAWQPLLARLHGRGDTALVTWLIPPPRDRAGAGPRALEVRVDDAPGGAGGDGSASEELYGPLWDASRDAVALMDAQGMIYCNRACLELFRGDSRVRFSEVTPALYCPPVQPGGQPSEEYVRASVATAYEAGSHLFELTYRRLDGTVFPAEVLLCRVSFRGREVLHATLRDITERRRTEAALRTMQTRVEEQFRRSLVGLFSTSPDQEVTLANPALLQMLGVASLEELNAQGLAPFFVDPDDSRRLWDQAVAGPVIGFETQLRTTAGEITEVSISAYVVRNEDGRARHLEGTVEDITERKRMRAALEESERRFSELVNRALVGVFRNDLSGRLWLANPAALHITGYESVEALNAAGGIQRIYGDPQDTKRLLAALERGPVVGMELPLRRADGTIRMVAVSCSMLRDDRGGLPFFEGTLEDITERKHMEAALQESRRRLTDIIDHMPDATFVIDREGRVLAWNKATEAMTGVTAREVVGRGDYAHALPFYGERRPVLIDLALAADPEFERRYQHLHVEGDTLVGETEVTIAGRTMHLLCRASPLRNAKGAIVGAIENIHDISDHVHAEARLRLQNVLLTTQQEASLDGILVVDPEDRMISSNRRFVEMWGLSDEVMASRSIRGALASVLRLLQDPDAFVAAIRAIYQSQSRTGRDTMTLRDGRTFDWYSAPMLGPDEQFYGRFWSFRDITEQKRTETALKESERILTDILSSLPTATFVIDQDGRVTAWNKAIADLTGVAAEEMIGKGDHAYSLPFYGERRPILIDLVCAPDEELARYAHVRRDDNILSAEAYVPLLDVTLVGVANTLRDSQGHVVGAIESLQDISEIRRTEAELEAATAAAVAANQAKSAFLATMSHEIRTPMNAIIGMTHLVLNTELSAQQRDYIDKAHTAGISLLKILNDLLDFSKIEAGKLSLESTGFALDDVLEALNAMVAEKASLKGLAYLVAVDDEVPTTLVGDAHRLRQVLLNLVDNAVKFTERGEVALSVRRAATASDKVQLHFEVRDTGIGLSDEQAARLFRPFVQADGSTTRKYGGTGLGLSICMRLVEMMNGRIWVEPGQPGTTFAFTAWFGLSATAPRRSRVLPAALDGLKVLVVDAIPDERDIIFRMLRRTTFRVDAVSSGVEAIAAVTRQRAADPYRLLLVDARMPEMDGIETARHIKADRSLEVKPTIIVVAEHGQEGSATASADVDAVLLKPVTQSNLLDGIIGLFAPRHGAAQAGGAAPAPRPDLTGARVLLVEDNEINQQIAQELLTSAGAAVTVAGNGRIALERVQEAPFDLVLMDLQMPEMDGFEATRRIRALPGLTSLPIVAMTAHALVEEQRRCLAAGMNDHISKPVDPQALLQTVGTWLRGAPASPPTPAPASAAEPVPEPAPAATPPLDEEDALQRLGGDRTLYLKLLKTYVHAHSDAPERIGQALDNGDVEEGQRLAHTLKGVAGNLGAKQVQACAARLETLLRAEGTAPGGREALEELRRANDVVVAAMQAQIQPTGVFPARRDAGQGGPSPEELAAPLARLAALLDAGDAEAEDLLGSLRGDLGELFPPGSVDRLISAVRSFDYGQALAVLRELAGQSGLSL